MSYQPLEKEDYEESDCPFCKPNRPSFIPVVRVIEKLDAYLFEKDFDGARRHLEYWLKEAVELGDVRGQITVYNELAGFYRKFNDKDKALDVSEKALELITASNLEGSVTHGTVLLNTATVYEAFEMTDKAVASYEKAKEIYEKYLDGSDERLGGLYNNYALALMSVGNLSEAGEHFNKALEVMSKNADTEPEIAVTFLNLADLYNTEGKAETQVKEYLNEAVKMLNKAKLRNENYAFVCEKCAPVFEYYGYKEYADELRRRAEAIYERA